MLEAVAEVPPLAGGGDRFAAAAKAMTIPTRSSHYVPSHAKDGSLAPILVPDFAAPEPSESIGLVENLAFVK